ncbi:MAG: hypothetical protein Q7J24_16830 [Desulfomicrobium sp.]|nr:hypothetical protein [Desulfomicrobium sp.]
MAIPEDVRNMLIQLGGPVTWTTAAGVATPDVPALITDQPEGKTAVSGRNQRVAQIRVSKADVPAITYRDTFAEADGTVWTVIDVNRLVNDRSAGTWRMMVETGVRGAF